ncbi:MAG: CarD family transcriptional regulator [Deltaproteobacteria bacterium]|nr:CarD family transcriptional regulator [Deltaproteobacteria bacterium]
MEFAVGDKAFYPAHGVGIVREISSIEIEGQVYETYVLKILENGMTIKVPVDNAEAIGLRKVMSGEIVEAVYSVLRDRDTPADKQVWNRRYREYMNKIKTGDPLEVAAVLRDLALLKGQKGLTFGERRMYDQAHSLILQELSVVLDQDEQQVRKHLATLFEE